MQNEMGRGVEAYRTDLAYVHDRGYGGFARGAAPGLLTLLRESGIVGGRVVDLGCGSGIWARLLVDAGYEVVGVDLSAAMIELASARVPEATFQVASFADFPFPPCRAVTALGEVFNYLFDAEHSLESLRQVCGRAFAALEPGGLLVFDVAEPDRHRGQKQAFREGEDWTVLVEYQHEPGDRLRRRIITFRKIGDVYRREEEIHRQQLYNETEVARILQEIGFRAETVRAYGDYRLHDGVVALIARKP